MPRFVVSAENPDAMQYFLLNPSAIHRSRSSSTDDKYIQQFTIISNGRLACGGRAEQADALSLSKVSPRMPKLYRIAINDFANTEFMSIVRCSVVLMTYCNANGGARTCRSQSGSGRDTPPASTTLG
ncbi:hypothetical protein BN77_p10980 [Rhizobium mesoamericanum STM3625]|uniref:Uncharacterized protein n=1 Tax=Rhizobium mesoamericanum STM3625 TaxID=1211777 RepID=K0PWZ6_9HYPH|nr:hypothetical protein BN77_p10980 [Rhizobium mesoamericanum STM3625]